MARSEREQARLKKARHYITLGKYESARKILVRLDTPTAHKWLDQMYAKGFVQKREQSASYALGVVTLIAALLLFLVFPFDSREEELLFVVATETPMSIPSPTPVPIPISVERGAISGASTDLVLYDLPLMWWSQGATIKACPALQEECRGEVIISGESVMILGEIEGEAWLGSRRWYYGLYEGTYGFMHSAFVTPDRERPTPTPRVSPPNSSGAASSVRPANCDEAVAMGLSPQEAARWPHLDKDNDGVACYGD